MQWRWQNPAPEVLEKQLISPPSGHFRPVSGEKYSRNTGQDAVGCFPNDHVGHRHLDTKVHFHSENALLYQVVRFLKLLAGPPIFCVFECQLATPVLLLSLCSDTTRVLPPEKQIILQFVCRKSRIATWRHRRPHDTLQHTNVKINRFPIPHQPYPLLFIPSHHHGHNSSSSSFPTFPQRGSVEELAWKLSLRSDLHHYASVR